MFDIEYVKERFKKRRMYFQALKSYCKNNNKEVLSILQRCINIKKLKELKYDRRRFPHLDEYWTYRGRDYYMRDIVCELIEIYIDISIKGYTDYCCELGMYQYGGCIASEVEYGSS